MNAKTAIQELQAYIRKLKKQNHGSMSYNQIWCLRN